MMKPLFLVCFLALALTLRSQKVFTVSGGHFHFELVMDSTLSDNGVTYECEVKSIRVRDATSAYLWQVVEVPDNSFNCDFPMEQVFAAEDMNFDGHVDFRVMQFLPAGPNLPYYYWIFHSTSYPFYRDTTLEVLTSPSFDPNTGIIYSGWRGGCCEYGTDSYRYTEGRLELFERHVTRYDEQEQQHSEKWELVDGVLTITKKE